MSSRDLLFLIALGVLSGCYSDWRPVGIGDTGSAPVLFFEDHDLDGWGDPLSTSVPGTSPTATHTARNNRDCDDNDTAISGRIGSLCPQEMVRSWEEGLEVEYQGLIQGTEFVVLHGTTPETWARAAEGICGPIGWGGHLATFRDQTQLAEILKLLAGDGVFGGYVGYRAQEGDWGWYDSEGLWVEDEGMGSIPFCSPRTTYDADLEYLALVLRWEGSDADTDPTRMCLGTPDEALTLPPDATEPAYEQLYGHFICEREIPDVDDWDMAVFDTDEL